MTFELPKLSYSYDALEPYIDARTMEIHYEKHHQAYVTNLNKAVEGYEDLQGKSLSDLLAHLDELPADIQTAVRNNGGGHMNHSFFWQILSPKGGGEAKGGVSDAIDKAYGSFAEFQVAFKNAALARFGSGWTWLCKDGDGNLVITSTPNQDTPMWQGLAPLLGLDVWEHAYYLNYQNRRGDYIDAWWNVVDWGNVNATYTAVKIGQGIDHIAQWSLEKLSKLGDSLTK